MGDAEIIQEIVVQWQFRPGGGDGNLGTLINGVYN